MRFPSCTTIRELGRFARTSLTCAVLAACSALTACSSAPPADASLRQVPIVSAAPVATDAVAGHDAGVAPYLLASGDEVDIKVADAPQYDQTVKVRPDGKVNLNLVGDVLAAGHSPEEVQSELRARYATLAGSAGAREYLIHANDDLEIKFPYHPNLNDQMRVRPDGKIQLQLAGMVQAEGTSPEELATELRRRYALYLKSPELAVIVRTATSQSVRTADGVGRGGIAGLQPTVMVRTFRAPQVFVTGEVSHPGMLAFMPGMTLMQSLAAAGGSLPSGDVTKLVIMRKTTDQTADLLRPDLTRTYRGAPTKDVLLQAYDVILLPPTRAQNLAEVLDRYVYKIFAPLKNSAFSYVIDSSGRIY